jgi:hypothetical protein
VGDEGKPKREPGEEPSEVVASGGEDGVDGISRSAGELVAVHAMIGLEVADDGFDRRAPPHEPFDGRRHAPFLRKGSPHSLICTKNQASYQRRVIQRK